MVRIPEYWDLWASLLRVEAERARHTDDIERWCSLDEARSYAFAIATRLRDERATARGQHATDLELRRKDVARAYTW